MQATEDAGCSEAVTSAAHLACCCPAQLPTASVQQEQKGVQEDHVADLRHHAPDQDRQSDRCVDKLGSHAKEVDGYVKAEDEDEDWTPSDCHMLLKLCLNTCQWSSMLRTTACVLQCQTSAWLLPLRAVSQATISPFWRKLRVSGFNSEDLASSQSVLKASSDRSGDSWPTAS